MSVTIRFFTQPQHTDPKGDFLCARTEEYCFLLPYNFHILAQAVGIPVSQRLGGQLSITLSEVQKVRQPGNLVARKFIKNQALAESFCILLQTFL